MVIFFSQCFSFIEFPSIFGVLPKLVLLGLFILFIISKKRINYSNSLSKIVILFMVLPFVSIISSFGFHGQSIIASLNATLFSLTYILFFYLIKWDISQHDVLRMCLVLGVFWCGLELIQQFTYPNIWFATRYDTAEKDIEIRNGIYRFNIEGREFGLILLFYCFQKFLEISKKKYLLGIIIGLIGVYLLATRQIMAAAIISIIYCMAIMKKIKLSTLIIISTIGLVVYNNLDSLFGDYIEMTESIDSDYIRFASYSYYGLEYNKDNYISYLIGNGLPGKSSYGNEIERLQEMGLYTADIGIVGMYFLYGILYVFVVIYFFIYVFRNRLYIEPYLQMYVVFMLVTSVMLHHFGYSIHHISSLCVIIYLIYKSIETNKTICTR